MNMKNMLECRYIEMSDDLETIGKILFQTDSFIYPAFLQNEKNAKIIIAEAIRRGIYCFSLKNIFCAFYENRPVAMICANPEGKYKWNYLEWRKLFENLKISIPCKFDHVAKHYFEPMNEEKVGEYSYILAVAVLPEFRNMGIGKTMLQQYIEENLSKKLLLDTLEENVAAVALYRSVGFSTIDHYMGYNIENPLPKCIRMEK